MRNLYPTLANSVYNKQTTCWCNRSIIVFDILIFKKYLKKLRGVPVLFRQLHLPPQNGPVNGYYHDLNGSP